MKKCSRATCPRMVEHDLSECSNCLDRLRRHHKKLRAEVLKAYGGKCKCCGIDIPEFLSVDHMNNDGTEHRNKVGRGHRFYNWLKRNDYPKGFQLLCNNCNQSLGNYGYCPHRPKIRREVRKRNATNRLR